MPSADNTVLQPEWSKPGMIRCLTQPMCPPDVCHALQATGQLLQLPVVRPRSKAAGEAAPSEGQLSTTMGRRAAAATTSAAEESSATLDSFLLSAGKLFGKDPTKWDQVGDEQVIQQSPAASYFGMQSSFLRLPDAKAIA